MQENFTPSDREKRKDALQSILSAAADTGLVAQTSVGQLADFLAGHGVFPAVPTPDETKGETGLSTLLATEQDGPVEDSEAPRFVRGFHDILISIGLVAAFSGIWGLGGFLGVGAAIPLMFAVVIMAEILVRLQRLALPAFVITGFFGIAALAAGVGLFYNSRQPDNLPWQIVASLALLTFLMGIFYWRYRVPVAFAVLATSGYATLVLAAISILLQPDANGNVNFTHPWEFSLSFGSFGLLVFATAFYFDLKDPERKTRRSDVAFWLFLVAAPVLVYTLNCIIFPGVAFNRWTGGETSFLQTMASAATIAGLMLIGILLDRRAFVTSGLLSLGFLFKVILSSGRLTSGVSGDRIIFVTLLLIGIIVLSLGIGWQSLRLLIVSRLPQSWQAKLPPIRG